MILKEASSQENVTHLLHPTTPPPPTVLPPISRASTAASNKYVACAHLLRYLLRSEPRFTRTTWPCRRTLRFARSLVYTWPCRFLSGLNISVLRLFRYRYVRWCRLVGRKTIVGGLAVVLGQKGACECHLCNPGGSAG